MRVAAPGHLFWDFYCTLNAIIYMHMCPVNIYKFVECSFSTSRLQNWVRNSFKIDKRQCDFVIYMLKKIDSIALLKMVVQICRGMETPSTRVSRATTPSQSPTRSVKHQPKSRRTQPNTHFDGMCGSNRPFLGISGLIYFRILAYKLGTVLILQPQSYN